MSDIEQPQEHDLNMYTVMELTEIQTYLTDTWENTANMLNALSVTATDHREQAILAVMLAQHRASIRILQYLSALLEGMPEEGDPTG